MSGPALEVLLVALLQQVSADLFPASVFPDLLAGLFPAFFVGFPALFAGLFAVVGLVALDAFPVVEVFGRTYCE